MNILLLNGFEQSLFKVLGNYTIVGLYCIGTLGPLADIMGVNSWIEQMRQLVGSTETLLTVM